MTSADIELAIIQRWPPWRTMIVPNVSYGLFDWGESDLIQVTVSGYVKEIEIKVSIADLKREWQKRRWSTEINIERWRKLVRRYVIAMPLHLCETAREHIPEWVGAGLIGVTIREPLVPRLGYRYFAKYVLKPKLNSQARPLTLEEHNQIGRLGTLRYWNLRSTLDELQRQKGIE